MTLTEHIKYQIKKTVQYEVNSEEFYHHWELLHFLIELNDKNNSIRKCEECLFYRKHLGLKRCNSCSGFSNFVQKA